MKHTSVWHWAILGLSPLWTSTVSLAKPPARTETKRHEYPQKAVLGPHHRWQERTWFHTNAVGEITPHQSHYVEVQAGMNYSTEQGWGSAEPLVEPVPGGARALRGQHQVFWKDHPHLRGAVEVMTSQGKRLRSHVLGLSYYDAASGRSVLLAEVRARRGEILPPNEVWYRDCFTEVKADLLYRVTREGLEQDVVLRERLPSPDQYGLEPTSTRLEVLTEFVDTETPERIREDAVTRGQLPERGRWVDPVLVDQTLGFGGMHMVPGRAFRLDPEPEEAPDARPSDRSRRDRAGSVPVGKRWERTQGREILVEQVEYGEMAPIMQELPPREEIKDRGQPRRHAARDRKLPGQREAVDAVATAESPMRSLAWDRSGPGVAIDYVLVNPVENFTFVSGVTYHVTGQLRLIGTTTIQGGAILKYAPGAHISLNGSLVCPASSSMPGILTADTDGSVGEVIVAGAAPVRSANPALAINSVPSGVVARNLDIRHAVLGVFEYAPSYTHTLDHFSFSQCDVGVDGYYVNVIIQNSRFCEVTTPYRNLGNATFAMANVINDCQRPIGPMSTDDHGNTMAGATPLSLGSTVTGRIESAGDEDFFRIQVSNSGTLQVTTSGSTDTYGYLLDANGVVLGQDDDAGEGYNFLVSGPVNAGTYFVRLRHYSGAGTGEYGLMARLSAGAPDDHGNTGPSGTLMSLGSSVSGTIGVAGDEDWFRVQTTTRGTLTVSTASNIDTYGYLYDGAWNLLTYNDDAMGRLDFSLSATLNPGWYYIRVRHYSSQGTGPYTLLNSFVPAPTVVAAPILTPSRGVFQDAVVVTMTTATAGAEMRYTLDGSAPHSMSAVYVSPLTLTRTTTLRVRAFKLGMTESAEVSGAYAVGPPGGLVGHWRMDDGSGMIARDASGFGHDGQLVGGASWRTDRGSGVISMDGHAGVQVASSPALELSGDLTLALWARKDAEASDWSRLIGKGSYSARNFGIWEEPGSGQRLLVQQFGPGGTGVLHHVSSGSMPLGAWCHVAAVIQGNQLWLYLNGELDSAASRSGTPVTNEDPLTLGNAFFHSGFQGALDDVRVYRRALSSTEVQALASDGDMDGLEDAWERRWFGSLQRDGNGDADGDGLRESEEYRLGLNPTATDSDGDGVSDRSEAEDPSGFCVELPGVYVTSTTLTLRVSGVPQVAMAVLVNPASFESAGWTSFQSSLPVALGSVDGPRDVWVGMRGITGRSYWQRHRVTLDTVPPQISVGRPTEGMVTVSMIHLEGTVNEPVASLTCEVQNAAGATSAGPALLLGTDYQGGSTDLGVTRFQCLDLELEHGSNTVVLRATDRAGNVTVRNVSYSLDLAGDRTAPALRVDWPASGAQISGRVLTLRGMVDDPSSEVVVEVGGRRRFIAVVERDGSFWVERVRIESGLNEVRVSATDEAGNRREQSLTITGSNLEVVMDPLDATSLNQSQCTVTGQINLAGYDVWVNGVKAVVEGGLRWRASSVPVNSGGTAVIGLRAFPTGSAVTPALNSTGSGNQRNPVGSHGVDVEWSGDKPPRLELRDYRRSYQLKTESANPELRQHDWGQVDDAVTWTAGMGGTERWVDDQMRQAQDYQLNPWTRTTTRTNDYLWDGGGRGSVSASERESYRNQNFPSQNYEVTRTWPPSSVSALFPGCYESCQIGERWDKLLQGTGDRVQRVRKAQSRVDLVIQGKSVPRRRYLVELKGRASEVVTAPSAALLMNGDLDHISTAKLPIEVLRLGNWPVAGSGGTALLTLPGGVRVDVTVQTAPRTQDLYVFDYESLRVVTGLGSPVEMAVDADRDREVRWDGSDQTSRERPFRFWLNNDEDWQREDHYGGVGDHLDRFVEFPRDLEDLSRLHVRLPGYVDMVRAGTVRVGWRWRPVQGAPAVRLFGRVDNAESDAYLRVLSGEPGSAGAQCDLVHGSGLLDDAGRDQVSGRAGFFAARGFWDGITAANPLRCLLFEGVAEGWGRLNAWVVKDGAIVAESNPVWLSLTDVKRMYARARAVPDYLPRPYEGGTPILDESLITFQHDVSVPYVAPPDERPQCVVFVHGWRMNQDDYLAFSETLFKRLWWQGFRGRLCAFRWPSPTEYNSYNTGEYLAWKYGKALKDYLADLQARSPGSTIHVIAHSMGNVLAGSALKRGAQMGTFVLMQGAVPAGCFDTRFNTHAPLLQKELQTPTPDHALDLGYGDYLRETFQKVGRMVPYSNPLDYALATGSVVNFPINWEANQIQFKPDAFAGPALYGYRVQQPLAQGGYLDRAGSMRLITDAHESMSFVARARSRAIGAEVHIANLFPTMLNLVDIGFGEKQEDHSGQFYWPIQECWRVYQRLIADMN